MAKNFIQEGGTIEHVVSADITSGSVLIIGGLVAIALGDVANGETGVFAIEGVWELPKSAGVLTQGSTIDYDIETSEFTSIATPTAGDLTGCGVVFADAADTDTTMWVKINVAGATVN